MYLVPIMTYFMKIENRKCSILLNTRYGFVLVGMGMQYSSKMPRTVSVFRTSFVVHLFARLTGIVEPLRVR